MQQVEYDKMYDLEDRHWWFVSKRLFARTFFKTIIGKKVKILDIGCGTGRNMLMLKKSGRVFGVDVNELALRYCRRRGLTNLKLATAESLPFADRNFDLVTIFDVLYHRGIKSDVKVLKEAFRVLKNQGYLLVTDCAHQWLFGPHDQAMQARQRYAKKELIAKVQTAGFSVTRSSYAFMFTFPLFLINRLIKKYLFLNRASDVGRLSDWLNNLLIGINFWENRILKNYNLPFGSSIIILAQKK